MKFKVGDKVKVKKGLKKGDYYGSLHFAPEMADMYGRILTIENVNLNDYSVEENGFFWNDYMLTKATKTDLNNLQKTIDLTELIETFKEIAENQAEMQRKQSERTNVTIENMLENVEKSIDKVSYMVGKKSIYDDSIVDYMIERIKSIPDEEIHQKIENLIEKYIKETYGILPKKIELKNELKVKEITGIFHSKFEEILKIISKGVPLMLTGPAGSGKNHTLEQVAQALDLDFYFTNAVTQEYKLTGFIDANGVYQETQFYKAFKNGGLFFLDEVDASCPESLIILNSAIANGYFDFPNGKVEANKDFRVVCAGNTYGTGADMVYVGRNALDGATLDRFATITFDYDEEVERQLAYDDDLFKFILSLRNAIKEASLRYIISMRATINATKLLEIGMDKEEILVSVIIKNMQIDDLNVIIKKMQGNTEWHDLLKDYVNDRN